MARPNTAPALSSRVGGVAATARRRCVPLMGCEAEVKAGEEGKTKEGPSSCGGKGNGSDGLNLY